MAGIFGFFDFTKPGKGVDPDEPEKRAFFRYFDILWNKKGKLISINFIYFICVLPLLLSFHLFFYEPLLSQFMPMDGQYTGTLFIIIFSSLLQLPEVVIYILLTLSIILLGPVTCGFTYILRNFVKREHAWLSDLWQRARMNFKQGLFLGILDSVMFYVGFFNISLLIFGNDTGIQPFIIVGATMVFIVYLSMRNTLYLMAVSVELTNFHLIRNSLLLSIDGLWRNLLTGLIYALYIILILLINDLVEIIVMPLFGFSLLGFTSVFISYPVIDKRLIQPQLSQNTDDSESDEI